MANTEGVAQYTERELSGGSITMALDSANGVGAAYIAAVGENSYLVLVNDSLSARAYDVNGADVTESVDAAILEEAATDAAANIEDSSAKEIKKLSKLAGDGMPNARPSHSTDSTARFPHAYSISVGGSTYYGFCRAPPRLWQHADASTMCSMRAALSSP